MQDNGHITSKLSPAAIEEFIQEIETCVKKAELHCKDQAELD
jgi:hypothetical protein